MASGKTVVRVGLPQKTYGKSMVAYPGVGVVGDLTEQSAHRKLSDAWHGEGNAGVVEMTVFKALPLMA